METKGKSASNGFRNAAILFFAATTCATAYFAYERNELANELKSDLFEMEVKLDYNAMEAQMASETFAEIESNLSAIRQSEGYLLNNLNKEDFPGMEGAEDRIQAEIETIEMLIADNKILISKLQEEVGDRDARIKNYKHSVNSLQQRVSEYKAKTQELMAQADELRKDLLAKQSENQAITQELAFKEFVVDAQSQQLQAQDEELRTGYYAVGSFKELKEENVVEKEGGFLGIAAAKTVKDDLNQERFTKIDIKEQTTIPVFSPKAEIISPHDPNSYEIVEAERETRWIKITDPELFWEKTKYLVVVTKGDQFRGATAQAH
jgi:chromosome segregation ATPase